MAVLETRDLASVRIDFFQSSDGQEFFNVPVEVRQGDKADWILKAVFVLLCELQDVLGADLSTLVHFTKQGVGRG